MKRTKEEKDKIYIEAMKGALNLSNDSDFEKFMLFIRDLKDDVDDSIADAIGEQTHKLQGRRQVLKAIIDSVDEAPDHLATLEYKKSQRKEVKSNGVLSHFT
jgi:acyl-CoA reductase-like NAD-dependent aldehyde dehydrogenase